MTIPASEIVQVVPSVLAAGGTGLNGIGLMLSNGTRVPLGTVASFANLLAVQNYFGAGSLHASEAAIYFAGFEGSTIQPSALLCAEYNQGAAAAYLRGGSLAAISLATLQGYSGTLSVTINGTPQSASVNLSGATSFSNAAQIINGDLGIQAAQVATATGSISGTTLTVSVLAPGVALAAGSVVNGTGVAANTYITGQINVALNGTGTYTVSQPQTALSEPLTINAPAVTFDGVSSAFVVTSGTTGAPSTITFGSGTVAASLMLTQQAGAVLSQGAAAASPAAFMNALIVQNSSWVNFMTLFDPDNGSGNAVKQAFAAWKNTAGGGNRFGYFCWDPDATPASSSNAPSCLGQILKANGDSGTLLVWEGQATLDNGLCAFALGIAASINYGQTNGRAAFAFKAQAGLTANVTDPVTAGNLVANGYNFYGAYGAANANFIWFQTGQITGEFAWADSWETQVWLNTFFQVQLLALFQNALSVPFTTAGISLIQATCQTVIQAGLAFGAFAPNTLTPGQIAAVNSDAGANIAGTLQAQGYYLQVNLPSQVVQAARGPWPITFFYVDRQAVQSIDLSSILVQ